MERFIDFTVRLIQAVARAYARKWSFLAVFVLVFLGIVAVLATLDLLPQMPAAPETATVSVDADKPLPVDVIELPMKIEISTIGVVAEIANPTTLDIAALDKDLLRGAVRYPTSASLGEMGNVVLFGHSSYLPVVGNQAYKTFNGIQKLSAGDVVTVYSSGTAYTYRVKSVEKESANNNSAIPLSVAGKMLTLVTCDSFGSKSDRFVVTADFVESHAVSG
jgi:LPXTG-site transpeptidase (sortase) family protein